MGKFFQNLKMSKKIGVIVGLATIFMLVLTAIAGMEVRSSLMKDRRAAVAQQVDVAQTAVEYYINKEASGALTHEQAQAEAKSQLAKLRFDGNNYFYILTKDDVMLQHPISPELNGKHGSEIKSRKGRPIFSMMTEEANKNGSGYVNYDWAKQGEPANKYFDKIAYVKSIPAWGWIVGSGIYVDDVNTDVMATILKMIAIVVGVVIAFISISVMISRDVQKAVSSILLNLNHIANNKDVENLDTSRRDEFGEMAVNIGETGKKLQLARQYEAEKAINAEQEILNKKAIQERIAQFEGEIEDILRVVDNNTQNMYEASENVSSLATEVSERASGVARASSETSQSVQTVASATEEMSASVQEISSQTQRFTETVQTALLETQRADETSQMLEAAAHRIGEVIDVIQSIAGQINLLALNATIESARAGEAGKGFAVVANEVKQLAGQTEKATIEISQNIANIKEVSTSVISALSSIRSAIASVEGVSSSISSAVEEQSAVTSEIAHNMAMASTGTTEIDTNINQVSEFSVSVSSAAVETTASAKELASQAQRLTDEIQSFLASVRAA